MGYLGMADLSPVVFEGPADSFFEAVLDLDLWSMEPWVSGSLPIVKSSFVSLFEVSFSRTGDGLSLERASTLSTFGYTNLALLLIPVGVMTDERPFDNIGNSG
jgi:hypothetical protein